MRDKMPAISIVITSYNDMRILGLVDALSKLNPFEIIIADGGSNEELKSALLRLQNDVIKFYFLPGNIAETRYQVQELIKGDIVVFIDTDELPTEGWLKKLISPMVDDLCDFTFGSTVPLEPSTNRFTRFLDNNSEYLYEYVLPNDILKGPLGNSAWKSSIIKNIGFDPCLGIGGEDYDLAIRAVKAGFRGKFVKDAVVFHDQRGIRTLSKFLKKIFYNYLVGASLAYRKNKMLFDRAKKSTARVERSKDPLEIFVYILKPIALLFSFMINPWEDERYCCDNYRNQGRNLDE